MNPVSTPIPAGNSLVSESTCEENGEHDTRPTFTHIAVVDDHAIIRSIFRTITEDTPGLHLVWTAADLTSAREQLLKHRPHLLVLDVTLPDGDGFDLAREVLLTWPAVRVLIITSHEDKNYVRKARNLGVAGFITKTTSPQNLLRIMQRIIEGGDFFDGN